MSDFELMKRTLTQIGIEFDLTDDSEESSLDDLVDTVIVVPADEDGDAKDIYFFFTRAGKYKEIDIV